MAGGPSTPALAIAAARNGGLGFVAAGYRTPDDLGAQLEQVRAETSAFAVNLFAPNPLPIDADAYAAYREAVRPVADSFGVTLPAEAVEVTDTGSSSSPQRAASTASIRTDS